MYNLQHISQNASSFFVKLILRIDLNGRRQLFKEVFKLHLAHPQKLKFFFAPPHDSLSLGEQRSYVNKNSINSHIAYYGEILKLFSLNYFKFN